MSASGRTLAASRAEELNGRAAALFREGKFAAAVANWGLAVQLEPGHGPLWANFGWGLKRLGRLEEAEAALLKAIERAPDYVQAHHHLAMVYREMDRLDLALPRIEVARTLAPDNHIVLWDVARLRLAAGDRRGWEHYDSAYHIIHPHILKMPVPMWRGEDLRGKAVWVHQDQGFGDAIMMARFMPLLAGHGARVLLTVAPPLLRLFGRLRGVADRLPFDAEVPTADYRVPISALAARFNTALDDVPVSYLGISCEAGATSYSGGGVRVGLVWAASERGRDRSLPISDLLSLSEIPGVACFGLQHGERARDIAEAGAEGLITDLSPFISDFVDAAAQIEQLDVVVTVDTAAAHLAGAVGKSCFLLLPFVPDWKWQHRREDSPWYPTMRLFRQHRPGDWSGAVGRVREALRAIMK